MNPGWPSRNELGEEGMASFEALFDAATERNQLLTRDEARHFIEKGYVVIRGAFDRGLAAAVCEAAWQELSEKGIDRDRPDSWLQPHAMGHIRGYMRTQGNGEKIALKDMAPRAMLAQQDVGGAKRLPGGGEHLTWGYSAIGNLGDEEAVWEAPAPQQPGWHKDGWHFRHFLDSPEQGLLVVPLFTDILPESGGTFIATDSIRAVAKRLVDLPQGLHPDSVQGAGYLIPGLVEQCTEFEELIGEAGDMIILHPFMLHRVSANPSLRSRFIANVAVVLDEPMCFARDDGDYSLTELTVMHALGGQEIDFVASGPRKAVVPGPFRDDEQKKNQNEWLSKEMRELRDAGFVTPAWGEDQGYMSNANGEFHPKW